MIEFIQDPVGVVGPIGKCLSCVSEYIQARKLDRDAKIINAVAPPLPGINDGITLAPSWQTTTIMGQVMVSCVSVPSCMDHLDTHEKSAEEKAMAGGLYLGGPGGVQ